MVTPVLYGSIEEPMLTLRKLTIEEYHRLGEAGILRPNDRIELIDGLLVQMAPIGPEHQWIVEELTDVFSRQKRGRFKAFRLNEANKYDETRYTDGSVAVQAFPDVVVRLKDLF
jgi:Uma2 family endonuclease